jgi:hypothetical protein
MTSASPERVVTLRSEEVGDSAFHLRAYLRDGDLVLEGQDFGPITAVMSPDGEYEYWITVRAEHLPALRDQLAIEPGADLLDTLVADWSGPRAVELERAVRNGAVPSEFSSYP